MRLEPADRSTSVMPRPFSLFCIAALGLLACWPRPSVAQQPAAGRPTRYYNREWSFDDVDIGKLTSRLSRIGVDIPVTLSGRISGTLNVGVPWNDLRNARAWRAGGRLTSPALSISGIVLRDVTVRLAYRDGSLNLDELRVHVPPPAGAQAAEGLVLGTARMELVPRGQLTATTTVADLPVATLLETFPALQPAAGALSGNITAQAPVDRLGDIAAWTLSGPITLKNFTVANAPPALASVQTELKGGVIAAHNFTLVVGPAAVRSEAQLNLLGRQEWSANAEIDSGNLSAFLDLINQYLAREELRQAMQVLTSGQLHAAAQVEGTLSPLTTNIAGHAELRNVPLQPPAELTQRVPVRPLTISQLGFDYRLAGQTLKLSQIAATVADGSITGAAAIPFRKGATSANLQWNGLQLAQVLAEPFGGPGVSNGRGNLIIPAGALGDIAKWQLNANVALSELRYQNWTLNGLQTGDVTLDQGRLVIPAFAGNLEGEAIALSLDMHLVAPWSIKATFNLPRLQLAWLKWLPQLAEFRHRLSGVVGATGSISGVWKPLQLTGNGHITGRALQFDAHAIDALDVDYELKGSDVTLSNLQAQLYRGRASGSATIALGDKFGGSATLSWNTIDVAAATRPLGLSILSAAGLSDGTLTITVPPGTINEREKWSGSASAMLPQLVVYGLDFRQIDLKSSKLADGNLAVESLAAQLDGQPVHAVMTLRLQSPWTIDARFHGQQLFVERAASIPELSTLRGRIAGRADLSGHVEGTLDPLQLTISGRVDGQGLIFDNNTIDRLSLVYTYKPDSVELSAIDASLYDGRLTGDVVIALADNAPTTSTLNWTNIDAARALGQFAQLPVKLQSHADGNLKLTIPGGAWSDYAAWDISAHLSLPDLAANRVSIASVKADVAQHNRRLTYSASGTLFHGEMRLEGERAADAAFTGPAALGSARFSLQRASLAAAASVTAEPREPSTPVEGTLSIDLASTVVDNRWSWRGDVRVADLGVSGVQLTPSLTAQATGDERTVQLQQLSGDFAGGRLGGAGQWRLGAQRGRTFRVSLRSARVERLMAMADGDAAPLSGPMDVELRVAPGEVWRIAGTASSQQVDVQTVQFSNFHMPIDADWHPLSGRVRVNVSSVHAGIAGGRITGRLSAEQAAGWNLSGGFQFFRIDLGALSRELRSQSSYGSGRLTGTLKMVGRNMHSINDLRATMVADLEDTQATSIPVISDLRNFVPGFAASGSSGFQQGRLEARLERGVVHVEELSLASRQMSLFVTGLVNLSGRLRLDATIALGQGNNPVLAQLLLRRLAEFTAPPVALLVEANDFLANRVIHAEIGGTIRRPAIRLQPLRILREEIVRFFLRQATGGVLPRGTAQAVGAAAAAPTPAAASSRR
jgi:hypothetical protein